MSEPFEGWDVDTFGGEVESVFAFLADQFGMSYVGARVSNVGYPDAELVATFESERGKVQVRWRQMELLLYLAVRLPRPDLPKSQRGVSAEPFIEFLTNGAVRPLVPPVYYGMSIGRLRSLERERKGIFAEGPRKLLPLLAERLREHLEAILAADTTTLKKYHEWYARGGL